MTDTSNAASRYREGRQAGRRGARESHEPRLDVRKFLKPGDTGPTGYVAWDGTNGQTEWGMDCNGPDPGNPPAYPNGLGDCGAAAPDHGNMAKANDMSLLGTLGRPKFAGTTATYFAYGVSQGERGQPPAPADEPDQGVDNASWLGFLYTNGIIDGYGEVPVDQLDAYAPKAHGLLIGQSLPETAEQDFEAHPPSPWGSPGETPDKQEGHDTWYIAGHADGSGEMVTWGGLQPFTPEYRTGRFITDAWLIFDRDDPEVDWQALEAALAEVHGTVVPPATPTPAPTPSPTPPPVPQPPAPLPPSHESWWQEVTAWIKEHVPGGATE